MIVRSSLCLSAVEIAWWRRWLAVLIIICHLLFFSVSSSHARKENDLPASPFTGPGPYFVDQLDIAQGKSANCSQQPLLNNEPCRPLMVLAPRTSDVVPIVFFLHGFILPNEFYNSTLQHVASWGFVVVAPSLYDINLLTPVFGIDVPEELKRAKSILLWTRANLNPVLQQKLSTGVTANLDQVGVVGHSRGGKVTTALALDNAQERTKCASKLLFNNEQERVPVEQCLATDGADKLKYKGVMLLDPVDGKANPPFCCTNGCIMDPPLTKESSLNLDVPSLVLGTGLGGQKGRCCLCPCAPAGLGHEVFYRLITTNGAGKYHIVANGYGHQDLLDDGANNLGTKACNSGGTRKPLRTLSAGLIVTFLKAKVLGDASFAAIFDDLLVHPNNVPVPNIGSVTTEWVAPANDNIEAEGLYEES